MAAEKERDPGSSSAEIGKYLDILAKDPNSRVFAPLAEAYRKGAPRRRRRDRPRGVEAPPQLPRGPRRARPCVFREEAVRRGGRRDAEGRQGRPRQHHRPQGPRPDRRQTARSARGREVLQDGAAAGPPGPGSAAVHREPRRDSSRRRRCRRWLRVAGPPRATAPVATAAASAHRPPLPQPVPPPPRACAPYLCLCPSRSTRSRRSRTSICRRTTSSAGASGARWRDGTGGLLARAAGKGTRSVRLRRRRSPAARAAASAVSG